MRAFAGTSLLLLAAEQSARFCTTLHYFLVGQVLWGWMALALLLPTYLAQGLSLLWFQADGHQTSKSLILIHLLQLGIWKRYGDALRSAMKAGGGPGTRELVTQQGDLAILRLLEALVQTLPNLLLQAYSCVVMDSQIVVPGLSAGLSLLSLSWALVSYSRFTWLVKPGHLSMPGAALLCQLLWRTGMIGSRVMTLVLFARVHHLWVFVAAGAHWLVMSYWIVAQQTDIFRNPNSWRVFNFLTGAVYIFCYISFKNGPSHYRVTMYYIMMALENILLLLTTGNFLQGNQWSGLWVIGAVMSGFVVGSVALVTYYCWLHPKSTEIWHRFLKRSCNVGPKDSKVIDGAILESTNQIIRSTGISGLLDIGVLSAEPATPSLRTPHYLSWAEPGDCEDAKDPWENHHHWLLVKLALKTGDLSKINAAFGDGGIGELYPTAVEKRKSSVAKVSLRKKLNFSTVGGFPISPKAVISEENEAAERLSSKEESSSATLPAGKPIVEEIPEQNHNPVISPCLEFSSVGTDITSEHKCHSGRRRETGSQVGHGKKQGERHFPLCTSSTAYFTASTEVGSSPDEEHKMVAGVFSDLAKKSWSSSVQEGQINKERGFLGAAANTSPILAGTNSCLQTTPVRCFPPSFRTSTSPEFEGQLGMLKLHCDSSDINLSGTWLTVIQGNRRTMEEPQLTSTPKTDTTNQGCTL